MNKDTSNISGVEIIKKNVRNVSLVKKCVQIYRNHKPKIKRGRAA